MGNTVIARIEQALVQHLALSGGPSAPPRLMAAMGHAVFPGGARIRPQLCVAVARACGQDAPELTDAAAVALEFMHCASLVHDDMPCMDNDDLRRGRPTAHKQFDEPTALLAGDALLTHAFALLAEGYAAQPTLAHALIRELADAAGSRRLIGGQMEDVLAEKKSDATPEELEFIHLNKTAAMIEAALVMGGLLGGERPGPTLTQLRRAGRHLGLAFQIIDDILDVSKLEAGRLNLERIAFEFPGVERAFAIQAGRELRVVVKPEEVDDQASLRMARELARRIEEELLYPGQIRITVVRETRCVEYAK